MNDQPAETEAPVEPHFRCPECGDIRPWRYSAQPIVSGYAVCPKHGDDLVVMEPVGAPVRTHRANPKPNAKKKR